MRAVTAPSSNYILSNKGRSCHAMYHAREKLHCKIVLKYNINFQIIKENT